MKVFPYALFFVLSITLINFFIMLKYSTLVFGDRRNEAVFTELISNTFLFSFFERDCCFYFSRFIKSFSMPLFHILTVNFSTHNFSERIVHVRWTVFFSKAIADRFGDPAFFIVKFPNAVEDKILAVSLNFYFAVFV